MTPHLTSDSHVALLVEDDPTWAKILSGLLLALGHTFIHATNLAEARAAIEAGGFCYVVLDMEIPAQAGMEPSVSCGETVLELLRKKYPHRNRDGRHRLQILVVTGYSNDGEFSSRLHQMDADVFVNKASLSQPGHLPDLIRRALAKAGRPDHAACAEVPAEPAKVQAEGLPAKTTDATPPRPAPAPAAARVRFEIDAPRRGRRVGLLVNGVRLALTEQVFLFLLRLVVGHVRSPDAWHSMADLGFPGNVVLPSRLRSVLEPVVPEDFVVLEKNGVGGYRLNPEVVTDRIDWDVLQDDDDQTIVRVAKEGARAARADVRSG